MELDEQFWKLLREKASRIRPYAPFWHWPDREVKELGIVTDFLPFYQRVAGVQVVDIKARGDGNDPPDCEIITADGFRIAVEVTELVDESAAKLRDKLEKASPKKRGVWYSPQTIRNWIRQGALPRNWAEGLSLWFRRGLSVRNSFGWKPGLGLLQAEIARLWSAT